MLSSTVLSINQSINQHELASCHMLITGITHIANSTYIRKNKLD